MAANWTAPKTWNTGDPLTASDMNTHIRDNLEFLKTPPSSQYKANEASDYTTTSTSFVNVDGVNFSRTIVTKGGGILITFSGSIVMSAAANVNFDVEMDGVRQGGDDGFVCINPGTVEGNASFVVPLPPVSAASHVFKLQWKVQSGTVTMRAGAGTTLGRDIHPIFSVRELG